MLTGRSFIKWSMGKACCRASSFSSVIRPCDASGPLWMMWTNSSVAFHWEYNKLLPAGSHNGAAGSTSQWAAGQSQTLRLGSQWAWPFGFWVAGTDSSAMMSFNFNSTAINFGIMVMLKCEMMAKQILNDSVTLQPNTLCFMFPCELLCLQSA